MKRYRIQITQELELPDISELRTAGGESVLKIGEMLVLPTLEYCGTRAVTDEKPHFTELDEADTDRICTALVYEKTIITEI